MPENPADRNDMYSEPPEMQIDVKETYVATISTDKGDIVVELFADKAPNTVNNFCLSRPPGVLRQYDFPPRHPGLYGPGGRPHRHRQRRSGVCLP